MGISVASLMVDIGADTSNLKSGINDAGNALSGIGGRFAGAGAAIGEFALAGGIALAGIGIATTKMAGDWQAEMTSLINNAGEAAGPKGIGMVSDGLLKMAVDTGTSATKIADGMLMVESAGYHGADGLKVMQAAAQGAKVGNADLTGITHVLTTAMHNYALGSAAAVPVVNSFIAANKDGTMVMDDLTGALTGVLPAAAKAGVSLTDIEGALSTMATSGDKGASAGTHLSQMLQSLQNPSSKASKVLKEVGLTTQGLADDMKKSLPDTLQVIYDALAKKFPVGSAAFNAAAATIVGGNKQVKAWNELTGTSFADLVANTKDIAGAYAKGGSAVNGWALVQGNFNQKIDTAREVIETLGIKIGTLLLPIASQLVDFFTGTLVPGVERLADSFQHPSASISALVNTISHEALGVFQQLSSFVTGTVVPAAQQFATWFGANLQPIIKQLANIMLNDLVPTVVSLASFIVTKVVPAAEQLVTWFGKNVLPVLSTLANVIKTDVVPTIEKIATTILTDLVPQIQRLLGYILPILVPAFNAIGWVISTIVGPALQFGISMLGWLIGILADVVGAISGVIGWFGNLGKNVSNVMSGAGKAIGGLWGDVTNFFGKIGGKIAEIAGDAAKQMGTWVGNIGSAISSAPGRISGALSSLWNTFTQGFNTLKTNALNFGHDLISSIISGITGMLGSLGNAAGQIASTVKGAVNNIPMIGGIAKMAGFASGTGDAPGGLAIVGENGPELVNLPAHSQVYPAGMSADLLSSPLNGSMPSGGGAQSLQINLQMNSRTLAKVLIPDIYATMRQKGIRTQ